MMKRRDPLGLGDPVVTNRFCLWGIGAGAAFAGSLFGTLVTFSTGRPIDAVPTVSLVVSMHGLAAAVAMWLAVLPPRAYLAFVANRARTGAAREFAS